MIRDDIDREHPPGLATLTIREQIDEHGTTAFIAQALEDIHTYMNDHDIQPAGPPFSICRPLTTGRLVDVETGWPVPRPTPGSGRIHGGSIPRARIPHRSLAPSSSTLHA
jgi:hypothetical protein